MSRHMQVFVDESAEPIPSQVSDGVAYGGGSESSGGWVLIEGSVREVVVVVFGVVAEDVGEVAGSGDQDQV